MKEPTVWAPSYFDYNEARLPLEELALEEFAVTTARQSRYENELENVEVTSKYLANLANVLKVGYVAEGSSKGSAKEVPETFGADVETGLKRLATSVSLN